MDTFIQYIGKNTIVLENKNSLDCSIGRSCYSAEFERLMKALRDFIDDLPKI